MPWFMNIARGTLYKEPQIKRNKTEMEEIRSMTQHVATLFRVARSAFLKKRTLQREGRAYVATL